MELLVNTFNFSIANFIDTIKISISFTDRAIGPEIEDDDDEDDGEDEIIEDEEVMRRVMINRGICLSCGQVCHEKFILDCGQQQFCGACSQTILAEENPTCPKCNTTVTRRIKLG